MGYIWTGIVAFVLLISSCHAANELEALPQNQRSNLMNKLQPLERGNAKSMPGRYNADVLGPRKITVMLSQDERCADDVKAICPKAKNNFAIMECFQARNKDQELRESCQHLIWNYKKNLTMDAKFDAAAGSMCREDLSKDVMKDCWNVELGTGVRIACLVDHMANITSASCKNFVTKMGSLVFSDYRLLSNFMDKCQSEIETLECGRLHRDNDDSPHTQGATIECLERKLGQLSGECKQQILRIAELQSDDYHLNRPLYYACRDDREKICPKVASGGGAVLKCLTKHKFDRTMSTECRDQLTGIQKLMAVDVKINRPLIDACRDAIRENQCFKGQTPQFAQARQSVIILCLESAIADDKSKVDGKCRAEVRDTRRSLMEDYQISPDLVIACHDDIAAKCNGGLERGGKTLHCLMAAVQKGKRRGDSILYTLPGNHGMKYRRKETWAWGKGRLERGQRYTKMVGGWLIIRTATRKKFNGKQKGSLLKLNHLLENLRGR